MPPIGSAYPDAGLAPVRVPAGDPRRNGNGNEIREKGMGEPSRHAVPVAGVAV